MNPKRSPLRLHTFSTMAGPVDMGNGLGAKKLPSREVRRYGLLSRILPPHNLPCPRDLLAQAASSVESSARHDDRLKRLAADLLERRATQAAGQTPLMHDIDALVSRILIDALRREKVRHIRVETSTHVEPGRIRAIAILHHRGREERRHIEVTLT